MQVEIELEKLQECFADLPDPRVVGRTTHRLQDILFLTLCALLCGMDDEEEIEEWGRGRLAWLRQFVPLENGIPSHDTIPRVLSALNPVKFQACFVRWMKGLCPSLEGEIIALDGKTVCGSRDVTKGVSAIHVVSAFSCRLGLTLGQVKTEEKSNEITALPLLIDMLDLQGATVTVDAMGCQKALAEQIVGSGAQYVFGLKGNQGNLHEAVQELFARTEWQHYANFDQMGHLTENAKHGRNERRRTIALARPDGAPYDAWSGLQSVVMVESMRQTSDSVTAEKRYFVSSLPPDDKQLAQVIRSHWAIENQLHWCLDVTFGEDACRNRTAHAPENLNIIRKIAINLLRIDPLKKTLPKKRVRASVNPEYLAQLIGASVS